MIIEIHFCLIYHLRKSVSESARKGRPDFNIKLIMYAKALLRMTSEDFD